MKLSQILSDPEIALGTALRACGIVLDIRIIVTWSVVCWFALLKHKVLLLSTYQNGRCYGLAKTSH